MDDKLVKKNPRLLLNPKIYYSYHENRAVERIVELILFSSTRVIAS